MENELNSLKELVKEEIHKIVKKGDMTPAELENANKAVCLLEKIMEVEGGMMGGGYSEGPMHWNTRMSGDHSYMRGRSPVTGRYISRGMDQSEAMSRGYSGHSFNDRMIAKLEEMYDDAKTEHDRDTLEMWIKRLETER